MLDEALTVAEQRLTEHGQLVPFGLVVDRKGTTQLITAEAAGATQSLALGTAAIGAMRSRIRAAALVVDVRLPDTGGDGVEVFLEHAEGIALTVLEPYRLEGENLSVSPLEASTAQRRIWR
ncbi:hypothetical protein [Nocardia brasiliensis]|uniref:hypothetical protein n=1 Tax=Nocardia brasiliensis TaxID=37326 RepID=UPI00114C913D|nr:hypothetical protein [Nocardia brasiliensis]